jgi:3-dehydroquinate synthase
MKNNFSETFENFKKTWRIETNLTTSFTVKYSFDVFNSLNHDLIKYCNNDRCLMIIDKNVYKIYSIIIKKYFKTHKINLKTCIIDSNESNKNWKNANQILEFFEAKKILRRETVVAVGGGVLLDIVGFCSSIYRRGIPYFKIPTTLLSIVDVSVGAKVAINHFERRNRLGSYYPPVAALVDKKFIETQNKREIINGIAEIFKLAIIKSSELFNLLEKNYSQLINEKFQFGAVPIRVINLAISNMIEELAPNLWEKKLDRCVDFGHTFSPIIEMKNIKNLLHGEAVALDCLFSSCIAYNRKYIDKKKLERIFKTAKNLELPTFNKDFCNKKILINAIDDSIKHRNNNQYLPLPIDIGNYRIINDLSEKEITTAIKTFKKQ